MPLRATKHGHDDLDAITKPKIIKNWVILGSSIAIVGMVAYLFLWPSGPSKSKSTAPAKPPNPLSGTTAPRDDSKICHLLGVTPDGRFVVATWRKTGAPAIPAVPADDRPPVDGKDDSAGFEIWDRQKGTRTRKNCPDPVYFDPSEKSALVIVQEFSKGSTVHRLAIETGELTKILDNTAPEYKDEGLLQHTGRRLFVADNGRAAVALARKASGELSLLQWDLTNGKLAHRVKLDPAAELVGVSGDGHRALVRLFNQKVIQAWDLVAEKMATTTTIDKDYLLKTDVFLKDSPFLADQRTFALRLYNLPENDPNARWTLRHFDPDTGKPVEVGPDAYPWYDSASKLWLRARDGIDRQTAWELVPRLGRDAPVTARLGISPLLKIRAVHFLAGKHQVACSTEIAAAPVDDRRLIQVFDLKTGSLYGDVRRPMNPVFDHFSLLATANGNDLLFYAKLEKDDSLEMWKITARVVPVAKKPTKPSKPEKAF